MDDTLIYRKIELEELNLDLFRKFERRQNVARQLQKQGDAWVEKPVSLVEEWSREDYEFLLTCLQNTIQEGGVVFGAFEGNAVKGFASISGKPFGYAGTYRDLTSLHVSRELRADRNSTSPPIRPSKASSFTGLWAAPTPWSSTRSM